MHAKTYGASASFIYAQGLRLALYRGLHALPARLVQRVICRGARQPRLMGKTCEDVQCSRPVKSLCPRASQYFSICPLRLAVTPWVRHGSETDLAAEVLDVLHEGVACELRAVVGDDSVWHTKTADQSLEKLDS